MAASTTSSAALSPLLRWHRLSSSSIALALSPSLCWHHFPHCAGIATLVVLALLPLLHWCCCCLWHGLPRRSWLSTCQLNEGEDACESTARCKHNKDKEACVARGLKPVHLGQQCQPDKSNDTSATAQIRQLDGGNNAGATTVTTPMQSEGRGSGREFVKFSNGLNTNFECSNLLD